MRFYLKLFVMIGIFACASRWQLQRTFSDLAYDARAGFICAFGSASDYEALIDDTQRTLASERGNLDLYLKGKRYQRLLAQRLAAATGPLSEDDLNRIRAECSQDVFGAAEDFLRDRGGNDALISERSHDEQERKVSHESR